MKTSLLITTLLLTPMLALADDKAELTALLAEFLETLVATAELDTELFTWIEGNQKNLDYLKMTPEQSLEDMNKLFHITKKYGGHFPAGWLRQQCC